MQAAAAPHGTPLQGYGRVARSCMVMNARDYGSKRTSGRCALRDTTHSWARPLNPRVARAVTCEHIGLEHGTLGSGGSASVVSGRCIGSEVRETGGVYGGASDP
eukprot:1136719-Prymnesium_polylepis.1